MDKDQSDAGSRAGRMTAFTREVSRRTALLATSLGAVAVSGAPLAAEPASGYGAPVVELSFPVGVLSVEQKGELIKRVTEVVADAMAFAADAQHRLFVEILETPEGGFGVNGRAVLPRTKP